LPFFIIIIFMRKEYVFLVYRWVKSFQNSGSIFSQKIHQMTAGSGIHIPAGIPHQLSNHQTDDLVFLVVSTPPSHGDRVIK
ncbi:cupin domain-containing protein, partial [Aliarcobacter butzleri]|uniref:cupin domain-containing protein n=1 Tax=Aliarcobacter butzleri TaxID=28197 RepID=UPI00396B22B1